MSNNKIQVTELDFDGIKQNLKTYLQGQSEFSDYNFDGSGMAILLDLLALNTHYNGLYLNLAVNEAFLDSASKRSSVVSQAKELGYTPRSSKSATANVTITMINEQVGAPTYIEIPTFSVFTTSLDEITYSFYNVAPKLAYKNGTNYVFENVELKEGTLLSYKYTVANGSRYILPNANIDTSTLSVTIQDNAQSSTFDVFTESKTIIDINGDSKVYFLKENYDGLYEMEFGNDIIGKALSNGNVINIQYLICSEDKPNGANTFAYGGVLPSNTSAFVSTNDAAYGGSSPESIDSIKWNAPRIYTTQNRCVTSNDYKSLIKSMYDVTDVNVWGGEMNIPPQYGKVYISVVPKNKEFLDDADKDYILTNIVNPRKSLAITPEFVEPNYLKLALNVTFYYNANLTTRTYTELSALILQTIIDYKNSNLNTFDGIFRLSRLSADIDNCETAITSNSINFKIHREIQPIFNINTGYSIVIGNSIYRSVDPSESVISSGFYIPDSSYIYYIDDSPNATGYSGVLRLFYKDINGNKVIVRNIGTLNYSTGSIDIVDLTITGLYLTDFKLIITPDISDVESNRNQFVTLQEDMITINPIIDNR